MSQPETLLTALRDLHLAEKHAKANPFHCSSCGNRFVNATLLLSHGNCPGRAERLRKLKVER